MKVFPKAESEYDCRVRKLTVNYKTETETNLKHQLYQIKEDDLLDRVLGFSMSGTCIVDIASKRKPGTNLGLKLRPNLLCAFFVDLIKQRQCEDVIAAKNSGMKAHRLNSIVSSSIGKMQKEDDRPEGTF